MTMVSIVIYDSHMPKAVVDTLYTEGLMMVHWRLNGDFTDLMGMNGDLMSVKHCHKPVMTANGLYVPPTKMAMTGAWFIIVRLTTYYDNVQIDEHEISTL